MTILLRDPLPRPIEADELLRRVDDLAYRGSPPFAAASLAILGDLSKRLLGAGLHRTAPQVTALGYWLRPAATQRLKTRFEQDVGVGSVPTPRGVAFHLPPTNVDTLFVYSWALALLAGNANIVRLPESVSPIGERLIDAVLAALAEHGDLGRHLFCSYDHRGPINAELSRRADLRLTWGGDAKVEALARLPLRPDGLALGFPDRKSLAVMAAEPYRALDPAARDDLATRFYNDLYWFDQMGCSSPRILFWLGGEDALAEDFYRRLVAVAASRAYRIETGAAISKLAMMNDLVAGGIGRRATHFANSLDVVELEPDHGATAEAHGGGFLLHRRIERLNEIQPFVGRQTQTIAHFGFAPEALHELAHALIGRGGYRLVPIGEALQFDETWDGIMLLTHMTRRIVVRP